MGFNFPSTPTVGQLYPDPALTGVAQYKWSGLAWVAQAVAGANEFVKKSGDAMSGFLTLHADPDAAMKAATKQFVDNAIASVDLSTRVAKTGDTMSGHLSLPTGPAAANAVRKDYVDAADALKLPLVGGTLTGSLTVNGGEIYLRRSGGSLTEGLMYFGSANTGYIHYNGTAFSIVGGPTGLAAGSTVPTPAAVSGGTQIATNGLVEDRAYAWADNRASAYFSSAVQIAGSTMNGRLTTNGGQTAGGGLATTMSYGGNAGSIEVAGWGGGADSMLSFHRPGAFACNFGLCAGGAAPGHFSYGGWSHGSTVYNIYSTAGSMMSMMMNQIADGIEAADVPETRSSLRVAKSDLRDLLKLAAKHFDKVAVEEEKQWRRPNGRPFDEE
jgi:hypothetical protein